MNYHFWINVVVLFIITWVFWIKKTDLGFNPTSTINNCNCQTCLRPPFGKVPSLNKLCAKKNSSRWGRFYQQVINSGSTQNATSKSWRKWKVRFWVLRLEFCKWLRRHDSTRWELLPKQPQKVITIQAVTKIQRQSLEENVKSDFESCV